MSQDIDDAKSLWKQYPWIKWAIAAMAVFAVLGIAGTFLGAASKVATAPARVLSKTMDTDNIIQTYEWFYDFDAAFTARSSQAVQFKGLLESETDADEKRRLRIEMAAQQQSCRELATKYNANSEKMNKSIFKGWSLPASLNINLCN